MTEIPKDLSAAIERLQTAGEMLANIAYNLSQQAGAILHPEIAKSMRKC